MEYILDFSRVSAEILSSGRCIALLCRLDWPTSDEPARSWLSASRRVFLAFSDRSASSFSHQFIDDSLGIGSPRLLPSGMEVVRRT